MSESTPLQSEATHPQSAQPKSDGIQIVRQRIHRTLWILIAGAAGMMTLLALLPATGHDQMWLLDVSRMVLHGHKLYGPEVLESNPPLMIWISTAPTALAALLHVESSLLLKLLILLAATGAALWSFSLLQRGRPLPLSRTAALWLAFVYLIVFGVAPARDFAQRDHLLAILCLPYLAAVAARVRAVSLPVGETLLIGFCAGIGICLKPHQALLFIAMEVLLLCTKRSWRAALYSEALVIAACGSGYIAAVHLFTPLYFTQALPLLRDCYWAFGHRTLTQLLGDAPQLHVLALLAFALWWRHHKSAQPNRITIGVLLIAGTASTLAYYLQATGWYYQQLPAISFFTLALALLLLDHFTASPLPLPRWTVTATATLILLALALTTHFTGYPFTRDRALPISEPDPALLASLPPGTPVYIMTTELDLTLPAVTKWHLEWASRMPHTWMLPAILRAETSPRDPQVPARLTPQRILELDRLQHQIVAEDLDHWKPAWVFIERCYLPDAHCQVLEDRHDNLLAWFNRGNDFRAAFAHYQFVEAHRRFDLYRRTN